MMGDRCGPHGLAVGPDGRCVVCRREASAEAAPTPVQSDAAATPRSRTLPLLALGLVLVGGTAYGVVRLVDTPKNEVATSAPTDTNRGADKLVVAPQPAPVGDRHADGRQRELPQPDQPAPMKRTLELEVQPSPQPAPPERPKTPTKEDVQAALRAVRITMYTTTWCPHCTRARAWLQANNFAFSERDVEASESARRERDRINPRKGVPTVDIDGEVLTGFGERNWSAAIARATQRRLDARRR